MSTSHHAADGTPDPDSDVGLSAYERGETLWPDYPPKRIWWDPPWKLYQWPLSRPFYFSGDEFWRRTFVVELPLMGRVVVAVSRPGFFDPATGERPIGAVELADGSVCLPNLAAYSPEGTAQAKQENLPYDEHGAVDWAKLRERQLRGYSTAELEAELARRAESAGLPEAPPIHSGRGPATPVAPEAAHTGAPTDTTGWLRDGDGTYRCARCGETFNGRYLNHYCQEGE